MVSLGEALAWVGAGDRLREELAREAVAIRARHWGGRVTYSRKVFTPLTTLCRDTCGYCTFVKQPGEAGAFIMTPDEVMQTARKGEAADCKEMLFSLGERPERRYREASEGLAALGHATMLSYLEAMSARVRDETGLLPHINAGTLTEEEMRRLKPVSASMGMMLETVSNRLMGPGMAHHRCPDKAPKARLATLEAAGRLKVPFTTGLLIGIGETWAERVEALFAIEASHRRHGHIQEVIIQNFRAKPGIAMAGHPEPSLDDMLLTLATARLILDPSISLQAPPNLEARHVAYLQAGINDWGGISPVTIDFINPERPWPQLERLAAACASAGVQLEERLTVYPRHLAGEGWLAPEIASKAMAMARGDGLAAQQALADAQVRAA